MASLARFCPLSPFSDQTHLQFYAPKHPSFPSLRAIKNRSLPLQSVGIPCLQPVEAASEHDLLQELADLKALLKQKKCQLKDQIKEKKNQLKDEMKEKKKALKAQKTKMTKDKDCSSSSSSSESSDGECESIDMSCLRQEQEKPTESKDCIPLLASTVEEISPQGPCMEEDNPVVSAQTGSNLPQMDVLCPSAKLSQEAGKIEVCVGGKCKKGGSEQLLTSLRALIPGDSLVEAVPCKCMGKCGMSINVKVQKQETNPQHHSHVGVGDATLLLNHHFGLGPPSTGLPSFGHQAMPCLAPERRTVST